MGPAPVWMLACRDRLWGPDKHLLRHPGVPGPGSADPGGLHTGCGLVGVGRAALRDAGGRGEHWSWAAGASRWGWGGGGLGALLSPLSPSAHSRGTQRRRYLTASSTQMRHIPAFCRCKGSSSFRRYHRRGGVGLDVAVAPSGLSPPMPLGALRPSSLGEPGQVGSAWGRVPSVSPPPSPSSCRSARSSAWGGVSRMPRRSRPSLSSG